MGVIANAQLVIKEDMELTDVQMEILVGCLNFVALGGSLLAGALCDYLGRRRAIAAVLLVLFAGAVAMAFSPGYVLLLLGRVVTGIGVGAGLVIVPIYVAEVSPPQWRGCLVTVIEVMINAGILLGYVVGWGLHTRFPHWSGSWRLMLGLGGLPPAVIAAALRWVPESPRWLIANGLEAKAAPILQEVHGSPEAVEDAVTEIRRALELEEECSQRSPVWWLDRGWYALLRPSPAVVRMLAAAGGVAVVQAAIGSSAIVYYSPQILSAAGFATKAQQMGGTVAMGATKTASVGIGLALFDRAGRRRMLLISTGACSVCLLLLAASLMQLEADSHSSTGGKPEGAFSWLPLLCLCSYMVFFSIGLGPGVSVVASEVFPLLIRSRGLSLCAAANRLVSGTVAMTFLSLARLLTVQGGFALYTALGCLGFLHIYATLPETKGMSLEAIWGQFAAAGHSDGCHLHGDGHGHNYEGGEEEAAALVPRHQHPVHK
mmetsp:Transcript_4170/g.11753  ORF Transcript_4170/g.11753 Transcript_4170/m.11753 type:complete len:488 (-) Transcript_4170:69-1532(-)